MFTAEKTPIGVMRQVMSIDIPNEMTLAQLVTGFILPARASGNREAKKWV
jgi:hypothetical protein